jgi:hypothetical protein
MHPLINYKRHVRGGPLVITGFLLPECSEQLRQAVDVVQRDIEKDGDEERNPETGDGKLRFYLKRPAPYDFYEQEQEHAAVRNDEREKVDHREVDA